MEKIKNFCIKYFGAIIGTAVSIVFLALGIYKILFAALIIISGAIIGNYIQKNGEFVKEKIKSIVERW